jgi:hypothetical protein
VIKTELTAEGRRVLKMLVSKYGMTEDKALQLLKDGGAALAVAMLSITR